MRGKGTKWMVVADGRGLPLGNYLHSASPAEVKLAETTLVAIRVGRTHRARGPSKLADSLTRSGTKNRSGELHG